jgi:hypothetical protein
MTEEKFFALMRDQTPSCPACSHFPYLATLALEYDDRSLKNVTYV